MNDHVEHVPDRVDNHVSLASPNVFASIISPLAPRFCRFDALAVDDRTGGLGGTVAVGALLFAKRPVDPAPSAVKTPLAVVIIHAVGIWKVSWEGPTSIQCARRTKSR